MANKIVKAKLRNYRMSPLKVREVINIIRNKEVEKAHQMLEYSKRKAAVAVKKLLDSAVANAENNHNMDIDRLYIKSVSVDEGVTWKRWCPRAQGRAAPIRKRTSHINIELEEK